MKGASEEYREGVKKGIRVSVQLLSRAWSVPRFRLQRRISGKVTGSEHVSGRKPYQNGIRDDDGFICKDCI